MTDKLIVSNRAAMQAKYQGSGLAAINAALQRLVAADAQRGLVTRVVAIDDGAEMASVGGQPVVAAADERGAKAAVDAAYASLHPDFIMLLDGPDVIPHIELMPITGLSDGDTSIPSDLPYASSGGWSRSATAYLSVTRVVGRLPVPPGVTDAAQLVDLLDAAAGHQPAPAAAFWKPFALSADKWKVSTQLSIATTFGSGATIQSSPIACHPSIDPALGALSHFVNCHGGRADPRFYGQQNNVYPVAMQSLNITPHVVPRTVVAAECCYGAELYDHTLIGIDQPICMAYLRGGACAFVGSTNIAYGPAASNGAADLITQYFMQNVLTGASSGRAFLQARQTFIQGQVMANPQNLKTLAQFVLFGDPSLVPCDIHSNPGAAVSVPGNQVEAKTVVAARADENIRSSTTARRLRRTALIGNGIAVGASASHPGVISEAGTPLHDRLSDLARGRGVEPVQVTLFTTTGGSTYREVNKRLNIDRKVAVVVDREIGSDYRPNTPIKLFIAYLVDDRIVQVESSESR